ncbi:MAG: glycoside hydrolase family 97 C-terminal domain-containing protein, partial [Bacteroidales bacterium]|nr:glycoside hydrolase family 97 C-terminal domain-containing protein [Bacteroidales bacterium]
WTARDFKVDLSFLPDGDYNVTAFSDGINADRYASDYKKSASTVTSGSILDIRMAPGGGWVARISPR